MEKINHIISTIASCVDRNNIYERSLKLIKSNNGVDINLYTIILNDYIISEKSFVIMIIMNIIAGIITSTMLPLCGIWWVSVSVIEYYDRRSKINMVLKSLVHLEKIYDPEKSTKENANV